MTTNNQQVIDTKRLFTAETMPLYYSVFGPHLSTMFPDRDLIVNPITITDIMNFNKASAVDWKFKLTSFECIPTDRFVTDVLREYAPNAVFLSGDAFYFKHEADLEHAKLHKFSTQKEMQ